MLSKDRLVSITGLAFTLGLVLGFGASIEVHPADVVSDNLTVTQTTFVTEQSATSSITVMDEAVARAKLFEGYRSQVYTFRGECHIGYGHLTSCGNTDVMTHDSASQLLQRDMRSIQGELMQALGFYKDLPPAAQVVLLDMGFNMGLTNLLEFEDMLGHMELGEWWSAISEIENSLYWEQVNTRAAANTMLLWDLVQEERYYDNQRTVF